MKKWLQFSLILVWLVVFIPSAPLQLKQSRVTHLFLSFHQTQIEVPGFDSRKIGQAIEKAFVVPKMLRDWGYELKYELHQRPAWLAITESTVAPTQPQIYLREEIPDEFQTPELDESYHRELLHIIENLRTAQAKGLRIYPMFVPPKIYANSLIVHRSDLQLVQVEKSGISSASIQVGSLANMIKAQSQLAQSGISYLDLLGTYEQLIKGRSFYPIYPLGESHWSGPLIEAIAPVIMHQLFKLAHLPQRCLRNPVPGPQTRIEYWGDLFDALNLSQDSFLGHVFETTYFVRNSEMKSSATLKQCPAIEYVGTSYGNFHMAGVNIVTELQRYYAQTITNHSISGKGPLIPFKKFIEAPLPRAGTVVIWEIPFRFLKVFSTVAH